MYPYIIHDSFIVSWFSFFLRPFVQTIPSYRNALSTSSNSSSSFQASSCRRPAPDGLLPPIPPITPSLIGHVGQPVCHLQGKTNGKTIEQHHMLAHSCLFWACHHMVASHMICSLKNNSGDLRLTLLPCWHLTLQDIAIGTATLAGTGGNACQQTTALEPQNQGPSRSTQITQALTNTWRIIPGLVGG